MSTKICKKCGVEKPVGEFRFRNDREYRLPQCKNCDREYSKNKYATDPVYREKGKVTTRNWTRANPEKVRAHNLKSHYGLTPEQVDGAIKNQQGLCAICGKELINPQVDHCHVSGCFRGMLCKTCNTGLGKFGDSFSRLLKAASYLRKFSPDFLVDKIRPGRTVILEP